jgi:phage gpG-like protein
MPAHTTPAAFAVRVADAAEMFRGSELMQEVALLAEAEAKDQISGPLRAVATGTLRRSITSAVQSATRAIIGTAVEYAIFVHDGTKWMKARPFFTAAIEELQRSGKLDRLLTKWGERFLKKLTGG